MKVRAIACLATLALSLFVGPVQLEAQQGAKVPRIGFLSYYPDERHKLLTAFKQGLKELGYVEGDNVIIERLEAEGKHRRVPALKFAQAETGKVYRIGFLSAATRMTPNHEVFRKALRELGYIEGQNIVIEWRFAGRDRDRLAKMAEELVRQKVDVIVTGAPPAPAAALRATRTIPIVVRVGTDRYVQDLRRPGGNLTGLSSRAPDLIGKQVALFKEALPELSRIAVLGWPDHPAYHQTVQQAEEASRGLGVSAVAIGVSSVSEFSNAFRQMTREGLGGVLIQRATLFRRNKARVSQEAVKASLPSMFGHPSEGREDGALIAYGTPISALFHRAATYVDKILKGANPGELPVERPTQFNLVVNLRTARQLDITIPPSVLYRANEVIR